MIEALETMLMKAVIGVGHDRETGVVCIVLQDGTEVYFEGVTKVSVNHPELLQ